MNNYEFWKDMDRIFDAIVAYQEKTIEFNKRFINPWVNLGNVFDKKENSDAVVAHKQAVEIDPESAKNWYELACTYTSSGSFEKSIQAYQKAIQLGLETGELYKNLGLAYAMTAQPEDSIPVFQKSLTMLNDARDKAVVWNHLGNVYRKLNNYDMALQAFQQADQLEGEIRSSQENVMPESADEISDSAKFPIENEIKDSQAINQSESDVEIASKKESRAEDDRAPIEESNLEVGKGNGHEREEPFEAKPSSINDGVEDQKSDDTSSIEDENEYEFDDIEKDMPVVLEIDFTGNSTYNIPEEAITDENSKNTMGVEKKSEAFSPTEDIESTTGYQSLESESNNREADEDFELIPETFSPLDDMREDPTLDIKHQRKLVGHNPEPTFEIDSPISHSAYEEYLKDNSEPIIQRHPEVQEDESQAGRKGTVENKVANAELNIGDGIPDLTVDMDTKNAQVWNELGNVYFNAGSYEDAIAAYSKAIELDKQFAWPYTNLAMAYVQKGRLKEAILLYQRSIELFSNEKDKSVTWNRLGNLYRRLDDYENAIAAYQRADDLDPRNTRITHQTKFSLLGSEKVDQEVGYSL